jgi:RNA polymerase sigma factor (sigma-70 family)
MLMGQQTSQVVRAGCESGLDRAGLKVIRGLKMSERVGEHVLASDPDRWISEARAGSMSALDKLTAMLAEELRDELNGRRVRGLSPSRSGSDLIQDTVLLAHEKFSRFKGHSFVEFKQWARGILHLRRKHCMRTHRERTSDKKKQRIWLAVAVRRNVPSQERPRRDDQDRLEQRDEAARAYAAFRRLKTHDQYVVRLRAIEGLSFGDIALIVNSTEGAVSKAYWRAIERLRRRLEP